MVTHWKGKKISTLPREELLKIIDYLVKQNAYLTTPEEIKARSLGRVELIKRGE